MEKSTTLEFLSGVFRSSEMKVAATAALAGSMLSGCEANDTNTVLGYLGFFIVPAILGLSILMDAINSEGKRNK